MSEWLLKVVPEDRKPDLYLKLVLLDERVENL